MTDIIFWNVDTQKDFLNSNGALYIQGAEVIKPNLNILTQFAITHKIKVINTADWHTEESKELSDTPDFKTTFPKHCLLTSEGSDFIEETYPKNFIGNYYIVDWRDDKIDEEKFYRSHNIIILKDAFDVFQGNKLTNQVLKLLSAKKVIVYGVATNVCVNFAVLGLLKRNYEVYVVLDAIKGLPNTLCDNFYIDWLNNQAQLITVKNLAAICL